MTDKSKDLEKPQSWDFNSVDVHQPVKNPRAVVSVAFSRGDYEIVARGAESSGQRVSEFIREAGGRRRLIT